MICIERASRDSAIHSRNRARWSQNRGPLQVTDQRVCGKSKLGGSLALPALSIPPASFRIPHSSGSGTISIREIREIRGQSPRIEFSLHTPNQPRQHTIHLPKNPLQLLLHSPRTRVNISRRSSTRALLRNREHQLVSFTGPLIELRTRKTVNREPNTDFSNTQRARVSQEYGQVCLLFLYSCTLTLGISRPTGEKPAPRFLHLHPPIFAFQTRLPPG